MPEKNEKQLESMELVQWVQNYGGKDLWKRWVWTWSGRAVVDLKTGRGRWTKEGLM